MMTLIPNAARFVRAPVFKKAGLRWATLLLGIVIVTGLLATFVAAAMKLGDANAFARDLAVRCTIVAVLCRWGLAAYRAAKEKESNVWPEPMAILRPPVSRLIRGRRGSS